MGILGRHIYEHLNISKCREKMFRQLLCDCLFFPPPFCCTHGTSSAFISIIAETLLILVLMVLYSYKVGVTNMKCLVLVS